MTAEKSTATAEVKGSGQSDVKEYPFLVKTLVTFTRMNEQGKEAKFKEDVVFKMDRASARMPWYVLRNYSVPKFLTKKYGPFEVAWQRIYEIKILKVINRVNPVDITDVPLRVMTLDQLKQFVNRWDLNVPVDEFYSVEKAREMVALRQQDEKGYERHLQEYREGKQRSYPELDNMRGDKEAATADTAEFENLDAKTPKEEVKKKPMPSEVVDPKEIPGVGDQPAAQNPFAGV